MVALYPGVISLASLGRGEGRASPPDDSPPKKKPRVSESSRNNMQTQQQVGSGFLFSIL